MSTRPPSAAPVPRTPRTKLTTPTVSSSSKPVGKIPPQHSMDPSAIHLLQTPVTNMPVFLRPTPPPTPLNKNLFSNSNSTIKLHPSPNTRNFSPPLSSSKYDITSVQDTKAYGSVNQSLLNLRGIVETMMPFDPMAWLREIEQGVRPDLQILSRDAESRGTTIEALLRATLARETSPQEEPEPAAPGEAPVNVSTEHVHQLDKPVEIVGNVGSPSTDPRNVHIAHNPSEGLGTALDFFDVDFPSHGGKHEDHHYKDLVLPLESSLRKSQSLTQKFYMSLVESTILDMGELRSFAKQLLLMVHETSKLFSSLRAEIVVREQDVVSGMESRLHVLEEKMVSLRLDRDAWRREAFQRRVISKFKSLLRQPIHSPHLSPRAGAFMRHQSQRDAASAAAAKSFNPPNTDQKNSSLLSSDVMVTKTGVFGSSSDMLGEESNFLCIALDVPDDTWKKWPAEMHTAMKIYFAAVESHVTLHGNDDESSAKIVKKKSVEHVVDHDPEGTGDADGTNQPGFLRNQGEDKLVSAVYHSIGVDPLSVSEVQHFLFRGPRLRIGMSCG
eukprot:PhF_6_TR43343/c0_g1_i2/m.66351